MTEQREPYIATPEPRSVTQQRNLRLTDSEMRLILRLRQAAGQGRLMVIDPDAMTWYLCGPPEYGR